MSRFTTVMVKTTTMQRAKGAEAVGVMDQTRHVPGTGFWNGASTLKQHFDLPKNGSKYYLKYTFLVFPVLGVFVLGTSLDQTTSADG